MATDISRGTMRLVDDTIRSQAGLLDGLSDYLQQVMRTAVADGGPLVRTAKNFLNGVWLGHPLHPALTDLPIGAWTMGLMFDLLGEKRVADAALATGILSAVPTALAGAADWADADGDPRRVGIVHAGLNSAALGLLIGSWFARRASRRPLGVGLSTAGTTIAMLSAWLGGELVYRQGTGVSRNAWEPFVDEWRVAARADELPEGKLAAGELSIDGERLRLVLLKRGDDVLALSAACSHWGGPLDEGQIVNDVCVECPWHGSQFDMRDGTVRQGPATAPQPCFETRVRDGQLEVRRLR